MHQQETLHEADIRRTLEWLHRDGETFEIRTMGSKTKPWAKTNSGYFDSIDAATAAVIAHYEEFRPAATYVTLNPVRPDLRSRAHNRIELRARNTTKDDEIITIRNLLIDADPERPKGVPATAEERGLAKTKVGCVRTFLSGRGFAEPLMGMSNNGWHLVYALDVQAETPATSELVKRLLAILQSKFGDDRVKIDTSVHNAARLTKVYGLLHHCGDDVEPRINKLSYIDACPKRKPVGTGLSQLVDELSVEYEASRATKPSAKSSGTRRSPKSSARVNVQHVLNRCGIGYTADGNRFVLDRCVFNHDHNRGEVAVFENDNGSTAYNCFHDSCRQWGWRDFVKNIGGLKAEDFHGNGRVVNYAAPTAEATSEDKIDHVEDEPEPQSAGAMLFPIQRLPTVLRNMVAEVSEKCNSHPIIVATTALAVLAACIQNLAVTKTRGWDSPVNLTFWAVIIADSAEGKSRGMKPMVEALKEIEDAKTVRVRKERKENFTLIKDLRSQALKHKGAEGIDLLKILMDNPESEEILKRKQLDDQIDKLENPRPTSCLFADATPEAMIGQMRYSFERAAVIQEEARFIDNVLGETYGKGEATTNLINMWDGSSVDALRKGSGQVYLQHPSLTICVCMTPEKFAKYLNKKAAFTEGGFAQRFLFVQANSEVKPKRPVNIDPEIRRAWDDAIKDLASMQVPLSEQETPEPELLTFTPAAEALLQKLSESIAQLVNRNRESWGSLWKAWVKRFEAYTIRIATYFHVLRHGTAFMDHDICVEDVKDAGALMNYFKDQADHILNGRTENEQERNERLVKAYLDKMPAGKTFTLRTLDRNMSREIKSSNSTKRSRKIAAALNSLIEDGYRVKTPLDGPNGRYAKL